jgi:hypothetical protein
LNLEENDLLLLPERWRTRLENIMNEKKYAELMISNHKLQSINNSYNDIRILSKYYIVNGMKKKDVKKNVTNILNNSIKKFDYDEWNDKIESIINRIIRDKKKTEKKDKEYALYEIDQIVMTKSELNKINSLNERILETLAFVILVTGKINQVKFKTEKIGVNCDKKLFSEAGLKFTLKNRKLIHSLISKGLININEHHLSSYVELLFADNESETGITIEDFEEIPLIYAKWKGENIKSCECGRLFEPNSNRHKMCPECKKKRELEQWRGSKRKNRNVQC